MSDTIERVKQVAADLLGIDVDQIADQSRFVEDLGAESIQSIELVAAFEEEFDIEMDEDAALAITNVSAAAVFIDKVIAGG